MQLEPLSRDHAEELAAAAAIDRSTYDLSPIPDGIDAMRSYIDGLLADQAAGKVLPFTQRRLETGEAVGCTRYLDLQWWRGRTAPDEVEIGGTWLSATAQRTGVNTDAKFLLMQYAFETLGVWRVAICTDARNERSRTAIERVGGTFEGVLRSHRLRADTSDVAPRDTAVYGITEGDWPAVKLALEARL